MLVTIYDNMKEYPLSTSQDGEVSAFCHIYAFVRCLLILALSC